MEEELGRERLFLGCRVLRLVEGEDLRKEEDERGVERRKDELERERRKGEGEGGKLKLTMHDAKDILQDPFPNLLPMSLSMFSNLPCSIFRSDHLCHSPSRLSRSLSHSTPQPPSSSFLLLPLASQHPRLQSQTPPHQPPIPALIIPPRPMYSLHLIQVHPSNLEHVIRFGELERTIHPKIKESSKNEGGFGLVFGRVGMNVLFGNLNDSGLEDRIGAETLRTGGGGRVGGRRRRRSEARGGARHSFPRGKVEFVVLLRVGGEDEREGFCEREEEERRKTGWWFGCGKRSRRASSTSFLPSSLSLSCRVCFKAFSTRRRQGRNYGHLLYTAFVNSNQGHRRRSSLFFRAKMSALSRLSVSCRTVFPSHQASMRARARAKASSQQSEEIQVCWTRLYAQEEKKTIEDIRRKNQKSRVDASVVLSSEEERERLPPPHSLLPERLT